ncbi:MAG: acylphosphatase [Promethearchaeota archaeon]
MTKRIVIKVFGRVQGVFFRHTTRKFARRLGVVGRVKNMPDGSVLIIAEGPIEKLNSLLEYSKRGPELARVDKVDFEFSEPLNTFKGFEYEY